MGSHCAQWWVGRATESSGGFSLGFTEDAREEGDCGWSLRTSRGGMGWEGVGAVAGGNRGLEEQPALQASLTDGSAGGEKSWSGKSGGGHADHEQLVLLTTGLPTAALRAVWSLSINALWSSPHPRGAGDIGVRGGQFSVKKADYRCADEGIQACGRSVEAMCLSSQ